MQAQCQTKCVKATVTPCKALGSWKAPEMPLTRKLNSGRIEFRYSFCICTSPDSSSTSIPFALPSVRGSRWPLGEGTRRAAGGRRRRDGPVNFAVISNVRAVAGRIIQHTNTQGVSRGGSINSAAMTPIQNDKGGCDAVGAP